MNEKTNSIGISKWASDQSIEQVWESGTGDNRIIGWEREDGERSIETNGDPVFEFESGFDEIWGEQTMVMLRHAIRALADSPAIEPVLSWDGKTYRVGSRLSPVEAVDLIVLSRQELGDFLFSEGGDWDEITEHDLEMAAAWVADNRDEWVSDRIF